MKKIISTLLLVLPFSMAYAEVNDKIKEVKTLETISAKYKYHFIKAWTSIPSKELEAALKNNNNKIPTDSIVAYENTILDKENGENLKLNGNTIYQRRIAYNKIQLQTQYNEKASDTNYSYGEFVNKSCLMLGVNLNTNNYLSPQKSNPKNIVFIDSLLHIEDHYVESNSVCSPDSLVKMKIKYVLASNKTNIDFRWIGIDAGNNSAAEGQVININDKEILLVITPNIYRKDKAGNLSYLNYYFYISLIE